jgi:hypothetical protein
VVFQFERIRGFRVDPIECLHELEDLGVEHAVNLVESECYFILFLGVLGRVEGLDCGGGAIEAWCCCLPPTRLPRF